MYVYVLTNRDKLYVGITENINRRMEEHRKHKCKTTAKMFNGEFEVSHIWLVPTFQEASRFERALHCMPQAEVLELVQDCPLWCAYLRGLIRQFSATEYEAYKDNSARDKVKSLTCSTSMVHSLDRKLS